MKKFLTLVIVVAMLIMPLSLPASASTVDVTASEAAVQPRLYKKVTISLGNSWETIHTENNWLDANLTVTNHTTSVYDVDIRIIETDETTIMKDSQTIQSGKSKTFYSLKSGGYIIQGRATDGVDREYTLTLED